MFDPCRAVLKTAAIAGLCLTVKGAAAEPVRVTYSSWCPHICTDADELLLPDRPGFAVELVRDALADQGFDVVFQPLPFSRQLQDVSIGRQDAVLHIKKAPDRTYVWPSVPTGTDQQCFVVRKDNDWTYRGIDSLEGVSIGAIAGYKYGVLSDYMTSEASRVEYLSGEKTDLRNLHKVALGRIDAFIDNRDTIAFLIQQEGMSDTFRFAGCLDPISLFLAFSPVLERSQDYADALDRGLNAMRDDGRLDDILEHYGLVDWQKMN